MSYQNHLLFHEHSGVVPVLPQEIGSPGVTGYDHHILHPQYPFHHKVLHYPAEHLFQLVFGIDTIEYALIVFLPDQALDALGLSRTHPRADDVSATPIGNIYLPGLEPHPETGARGMGSDVKQLPHRRLLPPYHRL